MEKKNVIIFFVAVLFFILGAGVAILFFNQCREITPLTSEKADGNDTFQAGWEAAKKRLVETGVVLGLNEKISIKSITGTIKGVQSGRITIKIVPLEPLAIPDLDQRIIQIDSGTKINKLVKKNEEQYQKEIEEFNRIDKKALLNTPEYPVYPNRYTKQEITIDELQVNTKAVVTAAEDVKNVKQFTAREITIQP